MNAELTIHAPLEGLQNPEVRQLLPPYLFEPSVFKMSRARRRLLAVVQALIQVGIKVVLRPRKGEVGSLDQNEVDRVYSREAKTYDWKHHMTTRGQDTTWRRAAAEIPFEIICGCEKSLPVVVLDLCTGTGLTVVELDRLLATHFERGSRRVRVIGLDFNQEMLQEAKKRKDFAFFREQDISFEQGDATDLNFASASVDAAMQMFGIGGIKDPVNVFRSVLRVLREKGQFFLIDMHRPIRSLPAEYPVFGLLREMPALEAMTYEQTTIPLALNRLWGWRDTTLDFYLLPFVTYEEGGKFWGFKTISRHYEPERWWLSLPVMPTMRITVEKVEISSEEAQRRGRILGEILKHAG